MGKVAPPKEVSGYNEAEGLLLHVVNAAFVLTLVAGQDVGGKGLRRVLVAAYVVRCLAKLVAQRLTRSEQLGFSKQ